MSQDTLSTKERLAQAIEQRMGNKVDPRVERMVKLAREGYYDDYESEIATPLIQLRADLLAVGFEDLAQKVIEGEFDGSEEEGRAWMDKEGWDLLMGNVKGTQGYPDVSE